MLLNLRDFSKHALAMFSKPTSTPDQMAFCQKMIRKPAVDRFDRVWKTHVYSLKDQYSMPE